MRKYRFFLVIVLMFGFSQSLWSVGKEQDAVASFPSGSSLWVLTWDDQVDGTMDAREKVCQVRFVLRRGELNGRFEGPVLGHHRDASFLGAPIEGAEPILLLRQIEENYTCVYQLQLLEPGRYFGVWHDTHGGKGDIELRLDDGVGF